MKRFVAILLLLIFPHIALCGVGSTGKSGNIDQRRVVEWNTEPYKKYVRIEACNGIGTGQFITKKHVLTNKHVIGCCQSINVHTSDDKLFSARLVKTGGMNELNNNISETNKLRSTCAFNKEKHLRSGKDWAIIEIDDVYENFEHAFFDIGTTLKDTTRLQRSGFGGLRVLSNNDITNLKNIYKNFLIWHFGISREKAETDVAAYGVNLNEVTGDLQKFKISDFVNYYDNQMIQKGQRNFYAEYINDVYNLKNMPDCEIKRNDGRSFEHTCEGWQGDSGSAILANNNIVVGLHNSGYNLIGSSSDVLYFKVPGTPGIHNFGVPMNDEMKRAIQELKSKMLANDGKKTDNPADSEGNDSDNSPDAGDDQDDSDNSPDTGDEQDDSDNSPDAGDDQDDSDDNSNNGQSRKDDSIAWGDKYKGNRGKISQDGFDQAVNTPFVGVWGDYVRKIRGECLYNDLPIHATSGHYIASGLKMLLCGNEPCSCAATSCEKGYYLVVNSDGSSQGWCYKRDCPAGQHLNIIDGTKTDATCVPNTVSVSNNAVSAQSRRIGSECAKSDLPANAQSGRYVTTGRRTLQCANGIMCSCAATVCAKGYSLMLNSNGVSQGVCRLM